MCDRRAVSRQMVKGIPECNGPAQRGELIARDRDRVSRGAIASISSSLPTVSHKLARSNPHARQYTRPLSSSREHPLGKIAPGIYYV